MGMGPRRAFGNTGQANDVDLALGGAGVTPAMSQQIVTDPLRRASVAAACSGETSLGQVSFDHVLEREINRTTTYCQIASREVPGADQIEKALRQIEAVRPVTAHDRYVIGGLRLHELSEFFCDFNKLQEEEHKPQLKLAAEAGTEWWRSDPKAEHIPTLPGIFTWNLANTMKPTNLAGHPMYLSAKDQDNWAREHGGAGRSTVEQITLLFQYHLIEYGLPMWGAGSIRGRNAYGSDRSLGVYWNADSGFGVSRWDRSDQNWNLGALPEVFTAFVY